jgi:hypothetical protein
MLGNGSGSGWLHHGVAELARTEGRATDKTRVVIYVGVFVFVIFLSASSTPEILIYCIIFMCNYLAVEHNYFLLMCAGELIKNYTLMDSVSTKF